MGSTLSQDMKDAIQNIMLLEAEMRHFQLIWKYTERGKGPKDWDDIVEDAGIFIKRISTANPISACTILLNELKSCSKNTLSIMSDAENN